MAYSSRKPVAPATPQNPTTIRHELVPFDRMKNNGVKSRGDVQAIEAVYPWKSRVLEDNAQFLALNKPAGILSQGDESGHLTITDWAKALGLGTLHPVHRLDRNVSGLLILARSSSSARELSTAFQHGTIHKVYRAIARKNEVDRDQEDGEIEVDAPIDLGDGVPREAHSSIAILETQKGLSGLLHSLDVTITTGRKHQIREHLTHAGYELVGDPKYGVRLQQIERPLLHSRLLEFKAFGKDWSLECPPPFSLVDALGKRTVKSTT